MNSNGPRIDPCGTPKLLLISFDVVSLNLTRCLRLVKQLLNHAREFPWTPMFCSSTYGAQIAGIGGVIIDPSIL